MAGSLSTENRRVGKSKSWGPSLDVGSPENVVSNYLSVGQVIVSIGRTNSNRVVRQRCDDCVLG